MAYLRRLMAFYRLQFRLIWEWRGGPRALLRRILLTHLISAVAFVAAAWSVPGIRVSGIGPVVLAVIALTVLNAAVRPVFIGLVAHLSLVAFGLVSIVFQVVVILVLGPLVPGLEVDGFWAAFWGSWVYAIVNTVLTSILAIDQGESYYGTLIRRLVREQDDVARTDRPGVVIVQIDGLPHPVLAHQIRAGRVPTMARWVRSESHHLARWEALLPTQTSASQAGILHGNNDGIPAFRWYEKASHRLMVSNRPADAAELVRRVSDGEGLLSNGGASINNLMSGDASRTFLTVSTLALRLQGLGDSRAYSSFFISPFGYLHMFFLFVGEALKEVIQARRQRLAGIVPRMHRGGVYPLARAATNVVLRALGTSLAIEEMYRGTPVIYIDYTDYDEIAHHSGPERAEALDSLDGIDRELDILERAAADAPRPYRFVVVSDHGQSLGATFLQRYGETLEAVVRSLMGGPASVQAATARVEEWGPLNTFLSEFTKTRGAGPAVARRALGRRTREGLVELGPPTRPATRHATRPATRAAGAREERPHREVPDVVVAASGNLGLVYFNAVEGRMTIEEIETHQPGLVDALANHPGIGLLLLRSATHGAIAVGRDGINYLDEGRVEGDDPVAPFGPHAVTSLLREDRMEHAPDILAISLLDPEFNEVAAFEELIGSHGGLGGMQTQPILLHPSDWILDGEIVGAPAVYRQLRRWIESTGHRLGPADGASAAASVAAASVAAASVAAAEALPEGQDVARHPGA